MTFRENLAEMKIAYPLAKEIVVGYTGSGDSFEEFYNVEVTEGEGDLDEDAFISKYNKLLWAAITATNDSFNNDGAEGQIYIDLVNDKVWAAHSYREIVVGFDANYDVDLTEKI